MKLRSTADKNSAERDYLLVDNPNLNKDDKRPPVPKDYFTHDLSKYSFKIFFFIFFITFYFNI